MMPSYRHTDVGTIPCDWDIKTLDSFALVTSGKRLPLGCALTEQQTPHPYIRVSDMRPGTISATKLKYVPIEVFPAIQKYRIFKDDIFISVAGTLGLVGKIPPELDGANLTENADRITDIRCCRDYLLHVLMSPLIQNTIDSLKTVGAQPKLALERIRRFSIPLPPTRSEQEAIAGALSDADALIEALEQLLAKKHEIKQGAAQELLSGRTRLPGFSGTWDLRTIGDIATIVTGNTPSTSDATNYGGDFLFVSPADIGDRKRISKSEKQLSERGFALARRLPRGAILFVCIGSTIGKCGVADRDLAINQQINAILPSREFSTDFLYYACCAAAPAVRSLAGEQAVPLVNKTQFSRTEVRLPSVGEQSAIATILSDMDAEIDVLEARLTKARQIKQGMMQELLTGRIRLV